MLDSFSIENFRTFRKLELPKLGRINLIGGKNNTGKTMLLEALRLHASAGAPVAIAALLDRCDEYDRTAGHGDEEGTTPLSLRALFHRRLAKGNSAGTTISLVAPDAKVTIARVRLEGMSRNAWRRMSRQLFGRPSRYPGGELFGTNGEAGIEVADTRRRTKPLLVPDGAFGVIEPRRFILEEEGYPAANLEFVPATGAGAPSVARWWDAIALTDAEDRVLECLRILAPRVERVNLVEHPGRRRGRAVLVRLQGEREPVSLRSFGEGMDRVFQFALAMANVTENSNGETGLLLIDELENGIHYSALPKLWDFLAKAAVKANVQVVATTHSWDCFEAFARVSNENPDCEGVYIRLDRDEDDNVTAETYAEEEMATAARADIEVRG